jgi:predicted phosphoribosyltransferase
MDSVTQENVENIMKEKADTEMELSTLKATSLEKMWTKELDELEKQYDTYKKKRETIQTASNNVEKKKLLVKKK